MENKVLTSQRTITRKEQAVCPPGLDELKIMFQGQQEIEVTMVTLSTAVKAKGVAGPRMLHR